MDDEDNEFTASSLTYSLTWLAMSIVLASLELPRRNVTATDNKQETVIRCGQGAEDFRESRMNTLRKYADTDNDGVLSLQEKIGISLEQVIKGIRTYETEMPAEKR